MRYDALDWAAQEKVLESARRFVLRLAGAVSSLKTYPVDHPSLQFSYRGVAGALSEIHDLVGTADLVFERDGVVVGSLRADIDIGQQGHMRELLTWLAARDAASVHVEGTVSSEQVQRFIVLMVEAQALAPVAAREQVNHLLASEGIGHLQLSAGRVRERQVQHAVDPVSRLLEQYLELAALAEELLVHGGRAGTMAGLGQACEGLVEALVGNVQVIPALIAAGEPLAYEARHVANLTLLAVGIGARLGLTGSSLVDLARAVSTMDAGMRVLPTDVRRSERELLPSELAVLQTHPIESVRQQLRERSLDIGVRRRIVVAMEAHLGVDRDGYPEVEHWGPLHLFSRIAAVCDAYDALTSSTGWRRGLPPEQAMAQLVPARRRRHDLVIVAELCALLGVYPPACPVRLSDGRVGAVAQARGPGGLPVVRLSTGERVSLGERGPDGSLPLGISEIMVGGEAARA